MEQLKAMVPFSKTALVFEVSTESSVFSGLTETKSEEGVYLDH